MLIFSVGCGGGDDGPEMYDVSGEVTFDGVPVESGRILFRSTDGGKAFAGEIKDGSYELETEPGPMTVEVTASRIVPGKFTSASPDDEPEPVGEMYIPAKYNSKTELSATVTEDGDNEFPFSLTAK